MLDRDVLNDVSHPGRDLGCCFVSALFGESRVLGEVEEGDGRKLPRLARRDPAASMKPSVSETR
jgi:hypothetical protein